MSGPKAVSKAGGIAIPASDRKLISTVKEVVTNNTDEEIYAMLKECNKDPNEAAARLMNEEKFHVVKRKKDRKKESGPTTESSESWQGNTGTYSRSGRTPGLSGSRSHGRGTSSLRSNTNEGTGGCRKNVASEAVKENGVSLPKTPSNTLHGNLSFSQLIQPKSSYAYTLNNALPPSPGVSNGELSQTPTSHNLEVAWPTSSGFGIAATLQGAWLTGAGHGTIAEMLKNGGRKANPPITNLMNGDVLPSVVPPNNSSEQFSSMQLQAVVDPLASLSLDSHPQSPNASNVVSRENGLVGVPGLQAEIVPYGLEDADSAQYLNHDTVSFMERGISSAPLQSSLSMILEHKGQTSSNLASLQSHLVHADLQEVQEGQFSVSTAYESEQFADSQQESTEWSSHFKVPPFVGTQGTIIEAVPASPQSPATSSTILAQTVSVGDNHSVIIPEHIRVPEADCTMLNFGSFGLGFEGLASNTTFAAEQKNQTEAANNTVPFSSSVRTPADLDNDQQIPSAAVQNLHSTADMGTADDETGIEGLEQPADQHEYPSSYSVLNAVSADNTTLVPEVESRPREAHSVLPPYDNSTYYNNAMFRASVPGSYSSLSQQLASSGKLGTSRPPETTGQSASQEAVNVPVYTNTNATGGPTMPSVNNGATGMTLPQHSVHLYANQPSGLPLGPFANVLNYPYMSPNFSYVQSPYQHNYVGGGNYHQVPAPVGAGGMKYPLPQYKSGGPVVGGMHNALSPGSLGYGGYPNTQPASNLAVTGANTSNFEDATPQHYKDNMYLSNQQLDGTSMWLQMQLAREAQGSSYYNVAGQNQPTRYSQSQSMLTHAHPGAAYGNVYLPQQSAGSNPAHQLLQQQQTLGSMGALGAQIGSYQQNQRAQPSWPSGGF